MTGRIGDSTRARLIEFEARLRAPILSFANQRLYRAAGLLCLALAGLIGCAAKLANPEDFANRGTGGGASGTPGTGGAAGAATAGTSAGGAATGGAAGSANVPTPACATTLFTNTAGPAGCSQATICHGDANGVAFSGLDLRVGFEARLINQAAKHLNANGACTAGDLLINTQSPADSWLLKKIMSMQGTCGQPMPLTGGPATAADIACLQTWVNSLAGR